MIRESAYVSSFFLLLVGITGALMPSAIELGLDYLLLRKIHIISAIAFLWSIGYHATLGMRRVIKSGMYSIVKAGIWLIVLGISLMLIPQVL